MADSPSPRVRRREHGASLVEFALIVPLLTMFLFGIVQFGIAYDKKQSINSAAREGARAAAIPDTTMTQIEQAVDDSFQALTTGDVDTVVKIGATTYPVAGPDGDKPCKSNEGQTVVVTARVDHTLTIPFFGAPVITLTGEGEFRCERDI